MKKDPFVWIALLSLFVFHLINNMVIVFRDTTPFIADAADYYQSSFFYWKTWMESVRSGDFSLLHRILGKTLGGQLIALQTIPFFSVFGVSHKIAILANQSFLLLLLLVTFGAGKTLFDRKTGLLAAFFVTCYPGVVGFSRVYMLELPLLAVSVACVYLLIKSEGFKHFKYALGFGFAVALGELIRPRFVIYILVPVFFYFLQNIGLIMKGTERGSLRKRVISIFASILLAGLILCPWYSWRDFSSYLRMQKLWFSWPALSNIGQTLPYYLKVFLEVHLGWFFVFLFILGLAITFFETNKRPKIYFLLGWFLLTFLLVSMFGLKDFPRVIVPLLAPVALLSAAGMERLSKPKLGSYLLGACLAFSVFQYLFISYDNKSINTDPNDYFQDMRSRGLLHARSRNFSWDREALLRTLKERRNPDRAWGWEFINRNMEYLVNGLYRPVPNDLIKVLDIDFRGKTVHLEIEEKILTEDLPITIMGFYGDEFNCKALFSDQELQHMVLGADYVLVHQKEGTQGAFIDEIRGIFDANISSFEKLKTVETPWGGIVIYGRKKGPGDGLPVSGAPSR